MQRSTTRQILPRHHNFLFAVWRALLALREGPRQFRTVMYLVVERDLQSRRTNRPPAFPAEPLTYTEDQSWKQCQVCTASSTCVAVWMTDHGVCRVGFSLCLHVLCELSLVQLCRQSVPIISTCREAAKSPCLPAFSFTFVECLRTSRRRTHSCTAHLVRDYPHDRRKKGARFSEF
jgi:hypothetical protein